MQDKIIFTLLFTAPIIGYNIAKYEDYWKKEQLQKRYQQLKESGKFEEDFKKRFPHLSYRK